MFPNAYWANSYFPVAYWAKLGEDVAAPTVGTIRFKLPPNRNIFILPARMQKFPLPANENEFVLKEGGQS